MQSEQQPQSLAPVFLSILTMGGVLLFLILVSGGFFVYVVAATLGMFLIGGIHYLFWAQVSTPRQKGIVRRTAFDGRWNSKTGKKK